MLTKNNHRCGTFPKRSFFSPFLVHKLSPYLYHWYTFSVNGMKSFSQHPSYNILSFERDVLEDSGLVGCYAVLLGVPIFRVKLSHLTQKVKKLWSFEASVTIYPTTQHSNTKEMNCQHLYCCEELSRLCSIHKASGLTLGWVRHFSS